MACACGGSAKNAETNRDHTVAAGGNPNSLNIGTTRTVVPMNAQRAAALGATNSNGDNNAPSESLGITLVSPGRIYFSAM